MPPISRQNDLSTGHGSFPPNPIAMGSTNVMVNSLPCARMTDPMIPHASPSPSPPHPGTITSGSGTVLVNSLGAARIGDAISCGQLIAMGSGNVICG